MHCKKFDYVKHILMNKKSCTNWDCFLFVQFHKYILCRRRVNRVVCAQLLISNNNPVVCLIHVEDRAVDLDPMGESVGWG